jgi:hypothetical protein
VQAVAGQTELTVLPLPLPQKNARKRRLHLTPLHEY